MEDEKELKKVENVSKEFLEEFSDNDNAIADKKIKDLVILKTPKDTIKTFLLMTPFLLMGALFILFSIYKSFNISNLTDFNNLKIDILEYGFKWFISGIDWNEYALPIVIGIIFILTSLYGYIYTAISVIKCKKKKSVL